MDLPPTEKALARIHELADEESLEVSRKARTQMDNLSYSDSDVCDFLCVLEPCDCEKLEPSHWKPECLVGTFHVFHKCERFEVTDELFVEVQINENSLYLLACKLYGSPQ